MLNFLLPNIHIDIERWKFNKNYQLYVSTFGKFKTVNKKSIQLKMSVDGYLHVPVCNNKKGEVKYIPAHRIVMETWCPQPNMWKDKMTVDHLDHNKRNNKYTNLEWITKAENLKRAESDLIRTDKDIEIQRLKSKLDTAENKVRELLLLLNKDNKYIIKGDNFSFRNWNEVKSFLSSINPSLKELDIEVLAERIITTSKNKKKYCGYKWKIRNES